VIIVNRNVGGLLSLTAVLALAVCGGGCDSSATEVNTAAAAAAAETTTTAPAEATTAMAAERPKPPSPAEADPAEVPPTEPVDRRVARKTPPPNQPDAEKPGKDLSNLAARAQKQTRPAASEAAPSTLTVEPAQLDMGTVATNKYATGTVSLINNGPDPITIQDCRTSCGCTSTNCPKGKELQPGESAEVQIRLSGGTRARKIAKTVTFRVVDQQPVVMPVSVQVVAYVTIAPMTIDPEKVPDGRFVIKATDEEPFRIVSMSPPVVTEFAAEAAVEHEVFLDWEVWRELGQGRRLVFKLDHPKSDMVSALVRATPKRRQKPQAEPRKQPESLSERQRLREQLREDGVSNKPLETPEPPAKAAIAVKQGEVDGLRKQLSLGVNEAQRNELLSLAARHGQVECMGVLIEAGASPKGTDKLGRTPLMAAVQSRDAGAIRYLLENGADVDARDRLEGTALLRAAGLHGNVESVQVLLSAGADVHATDKSGMTPLMWAARWGDAGRVTALLKAGAKVNARDVRGKTALDWARSQGEKGQEKVLILQPLTTEGETTSGQPNKP
jgi:hypothetical protein